eukprot:1037380-Pleurochrysis_carterae.AAC.1
MHSKSTPASHRWRCEAEPFTGWLCKCKWTGSLTFLRCVHYLVAKYVKPLRNFMHAGRGQSGNVYLMPHVIGRCPSAWTPVCILSVLYIVLSTQRTCIQYGTSGPCAQSHGTSLAIAMNGIGQHQMGSCDRFGALASSFGSRSQSRSMLVSMF